MVLYSMFWFVFALYLANGHSDWSNGPQQRLLCWGPEGPPHSSPSKRKILPWRPLVAKNCHQMVLYSMFWFVFALYLANGHSDWSNGPQQRLLCWGPEGPPA